MVKLITISLCTILLFLGSVGKPPISFSLPKFTTNIYPDSFALHWFIPGKPFSYFENKKNKPEVIVEFVSHGPDKSYSSDPTRDTIIAFSAPQSAFYIKFCLADTYNDCTEDQLFQLIKTDPTIDPLRSNVAKNPSVENYMRLAKAYEKKRCFVNEIFIINKIKQIDPKTGDKLWQEYAILYPKIWSGSIAR